MSRSVPLGRPTSGSRGRTTAALRLLFCAPEPGRWASSRLAIRKRTLRREGARDLRRTVGDQVDPERTNVAVPNTQQRICQSAPTTLKCAHLPDCVRHVQVDAPRKELPGARGVVPRLRIPPGHRSDDGDSFSAGESDRGGGRRVQRSGRKGSKRYVCPLWGTRRNAAMRSPRKWVTLSIR